MFENLDNYSLQKILKQEEEKTIFPINPVEYTQTHIDHDLIFSHFKRCSFPLFEQGFLNYIVNF